MAYETLQEKSLSDDEQTLVTAAQQAYFLGPEGGLKILKGLFETGNQQVKSEAATDIFRMALTERANDWKTVTQAYLLNHPYLLNAILEMKAKHQIEAWEVIDFR